MSLFSKKPAHKLILIIDLQSSIARGTLVKLEGEALPLIIHTHTVPMPYRPHATSAHLAKTAVHAVTETVHEILKFMHASPKDDGMPRSVDAVHFALSSPWIVSQTKTLSSAFGKQTEISEKLVMDMIEAERGPLTVEDRSELRPIEEKIFDVRLNGYSVTDWEARHAQKIEVCFATSIASTRMIERLTDACRHAAGRARIVFHSALLLQYLALREIMPRADSSYIIHAHGELTDLTAVRRNACLFFGSFPLGTNGVVRQIAHSAKVSEQSADSLLDMRSAGTIDLSHGKKSLETIANIGKGWEKHIAELAADAGSGAPASVFISARRHEDFFAALAARAFPQSKIERIGADAIASHVTYARGADRLRQGALYAIAIARLGIAPRML